MYQVVFSKDLYVVRTEDYMKFIHLSDLHLGKRVNEYSMIEDQRYILLKIREIVGAEKPDGVIIAGDIYDKSVPSAEAVVLFDEFLSALVALQTKVFVISGNHDSSERIAFASRIMSFSGVYLSPVYDGNTENIMLTDDDGEVNVYMLPFLKPITVRQTVVDEEEKEAIKNYNDAVKVAIDRMHVDTSKRNILITHQFVTGAKTCESEEMSVGGTENVDASLFDAFDYVALGHIHRPQSCKRDTIRYCGTPLKYSFSETKDTKSVTVVELGAKGDINLRQIPLIPMRDMVEIKGTYDELMSKSFYDGTTLTEDYVHITLTDEQDIPNAMGKLQTVYKYIMKLDYDNKRTRENKVVSGANEVRSKSPLELFSEFYELQNNQPMNDDYRCYAKQIMDEI